MKKILAKKSYSHYETQTFKLYLQSAPAPAGFASNPGLKYRTDGIVDAPIDSQRRPPRRSEDEQHINSASSTLPLPTLPVRDHNTQTPTASTRAPAGFTSNATCRDVNNDVVDTINDSQRRPLRRSEGFCCTTFDSCLLILPGQRSVPAPVSDGPKTMTAP